MAVITPSSLISEIRGSIGDVTYSRNRGGQYVKSKLVQSVTHTEFQEPYRWAMGQACIFWKAMSSRVKNQWNEATRIRQSKMSIAVKHRQSGFNMYVSRWLNQAVIGSANSNFSPLPFVECHPLIDSITTSEESILVNWSSKVAASNHWLVISVGQPINQSNSFFDRSSFRVIKSVQVSGSSGSVEIWSEVVNRFGLGSQYLNMKMPVMVKAIDPQSFDASPSTISSFIVSSELVIGPPAVIEVISASGINEDGVVINFSNQQLEGDAVIIAFRTTPGALPPAPAGFSSFVPTDVAAVRHRIFYRVLPSDTTDSYTLQAANTNELNVIAYLIRKGYAACVIAPAGNSTTSTGTAVDCAASPVTAPDRSLLIGFAALSQYREIGEFSNSFGNVIEAKLTPGVSTPFASARRGYDLETASQNTGTSWLTNANAIGSLLEIT